MIQGENRSYIATINDDDIDMSKISKAVLCVKPYGTSGTIEYEDLTIDVINKQTRRKFTQEEALNLGTGTVMMELIILYDGDRAKTLSLLVCGLV